MATIFIDLERLKYPYCGLGQFCLHLGKNLVNKQDQFFQPIFYVPFTMKGVLGPKAKYQYQTPLDKLFPPSSSKFDLWHSTHQDSAYLPSRKKCKLLLTIHDLNFLKEKSSQKAKSRLKKLQKKVDQADAISVISEFTRSEVLEHLKTQGKEVRVIHNGHYIKSFKHVAPPKFLPDDSEFLFTIGVVRPKKNFHVLLDLMLKLPPELKLVIAGDKNHEYADEIKKSIESAGLASRVFLPGVISNEDKYWLYQNCKAFVFPSLLEGFGFPVVEAMSFGKPVFLARKTALTEIGGDCAFFWDNFDPQHMSQVYDQGLATYSDSSDFQNRLKARAQLFSWEECANKYKSYYLDILENKV